MMKDLTAAAKDFNAETQRTQRKDRVRCVTRSSVTARSSTNPKPLFVFLCVLCVLCVSALSFSVAHASSIDRLNQFMSGTQSARGEFEQRIYNRDRKVVQESRGSLAFERPGKFRWTYVKPYSQLIVGDSAKVWIYDEELNQVTVRKMDAALGATPAALLAGSNDAMKAFLLVDQGTQDGLEWLEAKPREKESSFEKIRMGFGPNGLERMELTDTFGQTTVLRFTRLEANPKLDPGLFRFSPPKGADVVGEQ
jgi:outer membrane lipoprotein carrier protein